VLATLGWTGGGAHAQPAAPASAAEPCVGSRRHAHLRGLDPARPTWPLQGNTVFSERELAELTAPLENQDVSFERLQELSTSFLTLYVERLRDVRRRDSHQRIVGRIVVLRVGGRAHAN
jgi:hypothetical protein